MQLLAARKDVGGHSGVQQINMAPAKAIKSLEVRRPCRLLCTDAVVQWLKDGWRFQLPALLALGQHTEPCPAVV